MGRPLLELDLKFAIWLQQISNSPDLIRDAEKLVSIELNNNRLIWIWIFFCRKLARMLDTEACLNGSFLALPDSHYRTTSTNPGIDLNQVISVMEKLRMCDPKIQDLVCYLKN